MDVNAVILSGTLARDPAIRASQKGTVVAMFTILSKRRYGKNMEYEGKEYLDCVAFGNAAQSVGNNCKAGSEISIVGHLNKRKYTNKAGQEVWVTEINADSVNIPAASAPPPNQAHGNWGGFGQTPPQEQGENIPF